MRPIFTWLTIGLIIVGFINPAAWMLALPAAALAMFSRPPGTRADGRLKSGGPLGAMVDTMADRQHQRRETGQYIRCIHCGFDNRAGDAKCINCSQYLP